MNTKYLAIGLYAEEAFLWSIGVETRDAQAIAKALKVDGGRWPEQILLVQNDIVIEHWNIGDEYQENEEAQAAAYDK